MTFDSSPEAASGRLYRRQLPLGDVTVSAGARPRERVGHPRSGDAPGRLPAGPTGPAPRSVIVAGWASLIANILIVGTGGAVRLTDSGLGCPTWPMCTDSSLVYTAEMGVHGIIEFGNRVLTFLLVAIAVTCLLWVSRCAAHRRDLRYLSAGVLIGIVLQAGIGGATVLLRLHPGAVGVHYLFSAAIVVAATAFVYRAVHGSAAPEGHVRVRGSRLVCGLVLSVIVVAMVSVVLGTLTTGAGPHAGDEVSARSGLDLMVLEHLHAGAGYVLVSVTLVAVVLARLTGHRAGGGACSARRDRAGSTAGRPRHHASEIRPARRARGRPHADRSGAYQRTDHGGAPSPHGDPPVVRPSTISLAGARR